jgi:hypothetical protein
MFGLCDRKLGYGSDSCRRMALYRSGDVAWSSLSDTFFVERERFTL